MNFLQELIEFDVDTVPEKRWVKFKNTYLNNEDYREEKIKNVSQAAMAIITWAIASEKYF